MHEVIRIAVEDLDKEAAISKLECRIFSVTARHSRISLEANQPVPFGVSLDEIEHRIVPAYVSW
jgi:hypothetical protein